VSISSNFLYFVLANRMLLATLIYRSWQSRSRYAARSIILVLGMNLTSGSEESRGSITFSTRSKVHTSGRRSTC